ncbi:MAG: hypothetical protein LBB84_10065 [Tannerellaceae bacterium]|nr:hypothetical protein [Tannerellaceae bacterium]
MQYKLKSSKPAAKSSAAAFDAASGGNLHVAAWELAPEVPATFGSNITKDIFVNLLNKTELMVGVKSGGISRRNKLKRRYADTPARQQLCKLLSNPRQQRQATYRSCDQACSRRCRQNEQYYVCKRSVRQHDNYFVDRTAGAAGRVVGQSIALSLATQLKNSSGQYIYNNGGAWYGSLTQLSVPQSYL